MTNKRKDKEYEVHAVSVNTGGFTSEEIDQIQANAYKMGVASYVNIDAVSEYYQKVIKYLIFGNILKNNTYPLSVSAERIIQAIKIIEYAKKKIICADDEVMKEWNVEDAIVFSERIKKNKKAYGIKDEKNKKYIVDHSNLKIEITNVNLLGRHNQLNFMAAIATFKQFDNKSKLG